MCFVCTLFLFRSQTITIAFIWLSLLFYNTTSSVLKLKPCCARFVFSWLLEFVGYRSHFINKRQNKIVISYVLKPYRVVSCIYCARWKMFLCLVVLLATVVAFFLKFHYEYIHAFFLSLKIDGPPALPIIGNGLLFINNSSSGNKHFFFEIYTKFAIKMLVISFFKSINNNFIAYFLLQTISI